MRTCELCGKELGDEEGFLSIYYFWVCNTECWFKHSVEHTKKILWEDSQPWDY